MGCALMAISDAMDSIEAQNDDDILGALEDIANELIELVEDQDE